MTKLQPLSPNIVTKINKDGSTFTQPVDEFLADFGNPLEPNRIFRQLIEAMNAEEIIDELKFEVRCHENLIKNYEQQINETEFKLRLSKIKLYGAKKNLEDFTNSLKTNGE